MIIELIMTEARTLFPKNAEFIPCDNNPEAIIISWKLENDPKRPNKLSIPIILSLDDDFIDDYKVAEDKFRNKMRSRAVSFIEARMSTFNPDHKIPKHKIKPVERWIIPNFVDIF